MDAVAQRWRDGRDGFVLDLDRGLFTPADYEVVHTRHHAEARAFVEQHHYSSSWPSATEVFELRRHEQLVGTAIFSEPGGPAVLHKWFEGAEAESVELGRLVLLDEVHFNAETWFASRATDILWREGYTGIVSFSDPLPREMADGHILTPGHVGVTYQAWSAIYTGQTRRERQWVFADGTVFPSRCRTKIRAYAAGKPDKVCEGWRYAAKALVAHGASPFVFEHGDARAAAWCDQWLAVLATPRVHPGQHRYLKAKRGAPLRALRRRLEALKVPQLAYPQLDAATLLARARMNEQRRAARRIQVEATVQ